MLIIGKGLVVTGDEDRPLIKDGGVVTERDRILKVGDFDLLHREFPWAEVADARDMLILPGLINSREYSYREFAKGYAGPGCEQTADDMWKEAGRFLTPSQIRMSAASVYLEGIKNGVTTVFDCCRDGVAQGSLSTIGEVARAMGIRACLYRQASDWEGETGAVDARKENEAFAGFVQAQGIPRIRAYKEPKEPVGLGTNGYPHDMFQAYRAAAAAYGSPRAQTMLFEENPKLAEAYFQMPFGVLKPGAAADIIVVNYEPATPVTGQNIRDHLLYGVNGTMTDTTICAGHVLMYHRKVLVADEKETMAHCRQEAGAFWDCLKQAQGL